MLILQKYVTFKHLSFYIVPFPCGLNKYSAKKDVSTFLYSLMFSRIKEIRSLLCTYVRKYLVKIFENESQFRKTIEISVLFNQALDLDKSNCDENKFKGFGPGEIE